MKTLHRILPFLLLLAVADGAPAAPRMLRVGPAQECKTPSAAAAVAKDGDLIEIEAGDYPGDVAVWAANHLTIRGVHGMARLNSNGRSAQQKAIWILRGADTTVEHVEFSGCHVPYHNGAGIRQEGRGLVVRHCSFHDNENGILSGSDPESDVLVEFSEFHHNGFGDGYSHNLYIGQVRSFTLRFCSSHHAKAGHLVKSRALNNRILYNRLMDEADGTSSYAIDLPDGGASFIIGNLIQHGPHAENPVTISYAAEGARNAIQELHVVNNTCVNERRPAGAFVQVAGKPRVVRVVNNLIVGSSVVLAGPGEADHNRLGDVADLVDAARHDYRLAPKSPALKAGVDPGMAGDSSLMPGFYYKHPLASQPRPKQGAPDLGACPVAEAAP